MALTTRFCSCLPALSLGVRVHIGVSKVFCKWNTHLQCRFSSKRSWSAGGAKVVQTLKNDPFIKLSVSLCVIVLGATLVIELHNKFKKKTLPVICLLPPKFSHHAIRRTSLLGQLEDKLQEVRRKSSDCPVVYVTGPAGCGKTQFLYQYCDQYMKSHQYKWLGLKRVYPVVLYLDATSPQTLTSSLTGAVTEMGLGHVQPLEDNVSSIMSNLAQKQVPWLLVVDNLTEATMKTPSFSLLAEHMSTSADVGSTSEGTVLVASQDLPTDGESISIPSRYICVFWCW